MYSLRDDPAQTAKLEGTDGNLQPVCANATLISYILSVLFPFFFSINLSAPVKAEASSTVDGRSVG